MPEEEGGEGRVGDEGRSSAVVGVWEAASKVHWISGSVQGTEGGVLEDEVGVEQVEERVIGFEHECVGSVH